MSLPEHPEKDRYAMKEDTTVIPFRQSDSVEDPLTEIRELISEIRLIP